ncbi:MAG TPA: caspase family protein [Pseudomonadota bacterium]|nr:caspase family protein [Pseudomonadota bacterium]
MRFGWLWVVLILFVEAVGLAKPHKRILRPSKAAAKPDTSSSTATVHTDEQSTKKPNIRVLVPLPQTALSSAKVTLLVGVSSPDSSEKLRVVVFWGDRLLAQVDKPDQQQPAEAPKQPPEVLKTRGVVIKGVSCSDHDLQTGEQCFSIPLTLPFQTGVLSIVAETNTERSDPVKLRLSIQEPPSPELKPKLYAVAIGVSKYRDSRLRLRYAEKDATEFVHALKAQTGLLYRDVEARLLSDETATKAAILDAFQWFQRETTARDVAILFLAGHGMNDPSTGRYYFLPQDAELSAMMRSMVSQEDIQATLRNTPGKVILFLDTCHSGNLFGQWGMRGQADISAFVTELSAAQNGVVVFAASTGVGSSMEFEGNGVFTRALLEAIRGSAAYVAGRPTTVNMLELYLSERVKALSHGTQVPTSSKPGSMPDFPLFMPVEKEVVFASPKKSKRAFHKTWWFWTLTTVVLAGGVAGIVWGTWERTPNAPVINP